MSILVQKPAAGSALKRDFGFGATVSECVLLTDRLQDPFTGAVASVGPEAWVIFHAGTVWEAEESTRLTLAMRI